MSLPAWKEVS